MNKILLSFILTSIAGLSTILGYFIIYIKGNKNKIITLTLAFASGVMLTISVTDLIPSSFTYLKDYNFFFRLLLITSSFILGIFLSYYISLKVEKEHTNY